MKLRITIELDVVDALEAGAVLPVGEEIELRHGRLLAHGRVVEGDRRKHDRRVDYKSFVR